MNPLSNKTALVWDHGINLAFAQALGRENGFGQVLYATQHRSFNTKSSKALAGEGMPHITRVDSFWDALPEADVVVFPFLGDGDLQEHLAEQGKLVWGNRRAELLELDRVGFRKLLHSLEMDVADTDQITGLDALRDYMQNPENDDRFLKTSFFRGDFETFRHRNWKLSEQWHDELRMRLGPYGQEIVVLSEAKIDGCEPGWDGYAVQGRFPESPMWGYELKNAAYAGCWENMPGALTDLAAEMSAPLRRFNARGNFHFECRITKDGRAYLTDPTIRLASPAGESLCAIIDNWAEIVWHGAQGDLVEPVYRAKWAGQVVLKSPWSADHYMSVWVPPEHRDGVFFHSARSYEDVVAVMPGEDEIFGSAVALGDTMEEALTGALDAADAVEGYQVTFDGNVIRDMKECFKTPLS